MPSVCSKCGVFGVSTTNDFELNLATLARFAQLSTTNEPPRDAELPLIRSIVRKTNARLVTLEAEICQLRDRLEELKEERTALWAYHAQNTRILSPLRRMPPEILSEIFSWTLPFAHHPTFSTKKCPWILAHICRTWRAVAISNPSLWSVIAVGFNLEQQYSLEMVRIQIERAQELEIHFLGCQSFDSSPQIAMFSLLSEYSSRWVVLSIQLTSELVPHLMTLRNNLTALRRAWVQWDTIESQTPEFDSVDFFPMAISLLDIGVHCQYRFLPTILPALHQLTRYDFDAPWNTHRDLLKSLPNLQEIRIRYQFDETEAWPEPGEPLDVLHLRRLYVNSPAILDYLRAPNLEELTVGISGPEDVEACKPVERLLACSSCAPHRLCIEGLLDVQSMADILQKHPSFTEIAVTATEEEEDTQDEIISGFFALFTISASTPSARTLPHVTEIGFACQKADAMLYPLFLGMLESRWTAHGCALKAAELLVPEPVVHPDSGSIARARKLREAGLCVSLCSGDDAEVRIARWLYRTSWWV
ncbi:hypothetical protein C8R45DRAFT_1010412 [Mycena sanguinolenta]|nr:hypothetical protein C8R45DRAFT_1010412 [Mycena sanguinolenta]